VTQSPSLTVSDKTSSRPTNTLEPTPQPSLLPTVKLPSILPSRIPSPVPSLFASTLSPLSETDPSPTLEPTFGPSLQPNDQTTFTPTVPLSVAPTFNPTPTTPSPTASASEEASETSSNPTMVSTFVPSASRSSLPFSLPLITSSPSQSPRGQPTNMPTADFLSISPSQSPSASTTEPSTRSPLPLSPSCQPSSQPTGQPSSQPSSQTTAQPSSQPSCQPTAQPSSQPTAQPSSRPSSDLTPSLSRVVLSSVTRNSFSFNATLVQSRSVIGDIAGGYLYCAAMSGGSVPTSAGGIKAATSDATSSRGVSVAIPTNTAFPITLRLTIPGLEALKSYSVYCYAESPTGTGDSLQAVMKTKFSATTACCKSISFSNAPPHVYSDVTKYRASSSALYLFSYSLSSAPVGALTVTPELYINGVISKDIVATPSSSVFHPASVRTGQFFLSASPTFGGTCVLLLRMSGSAASQYSAVNSSVLLMSAQSSTPAPKMVSSQFTDSGQAVLIRFDSPTDQGGISVPSWPCSSLFSFTGADSSSCSWRDAVTVSILFGVITNTNSGQILNVGRGVTLRSGKLRAFCTVSDCFSNPAATEATVTALAPPNPCSPTVVVCAPESINSCANLTLDATGSYGNGGRPYLSAIWSVTATSKDNRLLPLDASPIQRYLNNFSALNQVRSPIKVLGGSLVSATYAFTLCLTNCFGLQSCRTSTVDFISDTKAPSLSIVGPSYRTVLVASPLVILSTASLSSCSLSTSAVKYTWSVRLKGDTVPIYSTSRDPSCFALPSYSLLVDKTYTVTVTASAGTSSAAASVDVYVAHGPVSAAAVGGYTRSAPLDKPFVLDGSISYDADNQTSSTLAYQVIE
jgi:REJ domain/PT repeat